MCLFIFWKALKMKSSVSQGDRERVTWALGVMSKEKSVEENKKEDFSLPGDRQSGCGQ